MRLDDRLEALLAQMTLEEKVGQLGIFADMLRPFAPGINPEMNEQDATQTLELVRSGRAGALFNGIGAALGREAPISGSPLEDHHEHVLLRIEQDIARRACRAATRGSAHHDRRGPSPLDHKPHDLSPSGQVRQDIAHLDLPVPATPRRLRVVLDPDTFGPHYDEPPF